VITILGLVAMAVYLVSWRKRPAHRKFRSWVAIVAGGCFVGGSGWMAAGIARVMGWGASLSAATTGRLAGVGVAWFTALVVVLLVAYDLGLDDRITRMRKGGGGSTGGAGRGGLATRLSGGGAGAVTWYTPWLSFLVPAALLALSGLGPQIWTGAQQLANRFGG
jgi:hypothetical protein